MKFALWFHVAACWLAVVSGGRCLQKENTTELQDMLWTFYMQETDASIFNDPEKKRELQSDDHDDQVRSRSPWHTLPLVAPRLRFRTDIDRRQQCQATSRRTKRVETRHRARSMRRRRKGRDLTSSDRTLHELKRRLQRRMQRLLVTVSAVFNNAFLLLRQGAPSGLAKKAMKLERGRRRGKTHTRRHSSHLHAGATILSLRERLRRAERFLDAREDMTTGPWSKHKHFLSLLKRQLRLIVKMMAFLEGFPESDQLATGRNSKREPGTPSHLHPGQDRDWLRGRSGRKRQLREFARRQWNQEVSCGQHQVLDYDPERFPPFVYRIECCQKRPPGVAGYVCEEVVVLKKVLRLVNGCYVPVLEPLPVRCHARKV